MGRIIEHDHPVTDTHEDKYFQINPITREIVNTGSTKKLTLIKGDHNSEVFTFELPRIIEGHDMSLCNKVTVHFINIGTSKDQSENVYTIYKRNVDEPDPEGGVFYREPDMEEDDLIEGRTYDTQFGVLTDTDENGEPIDEEKQVVVASWLISRAATEFRGTLSFVVRFECINAEDESTLTYSGDVFTLINGNKVITLDNSIVCIEDDDLKSIDLRNLNYIGEWDPNKEGEYEEAPNEEGEYESFLLSTGYYFIASASSAKEDSWYPQGGHPANIEFNKGDVVIVKGFSQETGNWAYAKCVNAGSEPLTTNDGRVISLSEGGYPQVTETKFLVDYSWSSAIYSKINIADTHSNSEEAIEPYHDILENWWNKICQASDTLYAITDDGVLLNVTEKVNGLQDTVQSLTETVESLVETVEENKNACDTALKTATDYTDTEVSSLDASIQADLTTIRTNHNTLQSKVDGLPTTSTTLYKHDIMLALETSSEAPSESRTLTVHAISIITNSKTSPEFTFINGQPNSVNCVKITGEIIKMTYHGPTGQNIKIIELPDGWSAKWPSSLNIGYPLFIASVDKLSYIENTDTPLTYAQKFYKITEVGEWSDIARTIAESYVSSNFSKHIKTTKL